MSKDNVSRKSKNLIDILNEQNIRYRYINNILIFSLILVSLVLLAKSAYAYERVEFKDGLTEKWHPGGYCIPCHYTLLGTEKARAISYNCYKCHDLRPKDAKSKYEIDMTKVYDIHKDIVCIRCHVGIKDEKNVTAADFHRIMSKTACLSCHTFDNGTYIKPQKTKCSDCHGGDPHIVHGKKVENMCTACHGEEFGEKYVKPPAALIPSIGKPEVSIKEVPTIGGFISKIIESLIRIIRG